MFSHLVFAVTVVAAGARTGSRKTLQHDQYCMKTTPGQFI